MPNFSKPAADEPEDLRHGLRGHLTVREAPLAGADPLHRLDDPHPVSPNLATPPGQVTHA